MSAEPSTNGASSGPFSSTDLASMQAAIREEMAAAKESAKTAWLDIDAIEHLQDVAGHYVYRLALSTPSHFSSDQAVTFETRKPKDTIPAVIVHSDDEGIVVECEKPLPTDAKLLSMAFDPSFILKALEDFLVQLVGSAGPMARLVANRTIPAPNRSASRTLDGLNEDQCLAVGEMSSTPLHLLWGPPGTGKTTTLGAAVVDWMRQDKTVLLVSTSNAAVDVAMRAILKRTRPDEKRFLLRLGTSLAPEVKEITANGKMAQKAGPLTGAAMLAQYRLRKIRESLSNRNLQAEQREVLFAEAAKYERQIEQTMRRMVSALPQLVAEVRVTGCTLAKMVLDQDLRKSRFDVVVLDEASMASLLYAIAASFLAGSHLVYGGDPKQLPPIVQAKGANAQKWFGKSIYEWFGVDMGDEVAATKLSLLRTQYRMTNQIGGVVSRLSYNDLLQHGRGANGPRVEFIEIPTEWATTHYSVADHSYYHFAAIPAIHALADLLSQDELLLLSPFRPQRSLLSALAFDLKQKRAEGKITASTIHRAQGSEAKVVVVDLTTHSPQQLVAFFRDRHCAKLFNVAISRARDHLVILGSRAMLHQLAQGMPFWRTVLREFGRGIDPMPCEEAIEDLEHFESLSDIPLKGAKQFPAIYCHSPALGPLEPAVEMLKGIEAGRKLLVIPDAYTQVVEGDFILRRSTACPPVFVGGGRVCLPHGKRWVVVDSPNVSRVVWRIAFSHLADDEVDPIQAKRFFCPECANGDLILRRYTGEGWFLACTNSQAHECYYRRRLSLEDAKLKVRLQEMRCPEGHPLTARQSPKGIFLGCENYPDCQCSESLSILEGV